MKFKDNYYSQNKLVNTKYTKNDWLRYKDKYYRWASSSDFQRAFGVEIKPKHRHRRGIAIRDLKRLYKCTHYELGRSEKWVKKYRIFVYHY